MTSDDAPDYARLAEANLTPVLGRYFLKSWSHGVGHRLYDTDGKAHLDFANGIAVTALGHVHPRVTAAIHAQVDRLIGPISAIGFAEPISRLAVELAGTFPEPLDSVMFLNSGSEAIDGALKLARAQAGRASSRSGAARPDVRGGQRDTSNISYRTGYGRSSRASRCPNPYHDTDGDAGGVGPPRWRLSGRCSRRWSRRPRSGHLIEPVLGEGGDPRPASFLRGLRAICDEHGILLIADEVQSGYGRTGRMWGFEHAGIVPDVVTVAKAIANGLPLSAIVSSRELQERWGRGAHGSTYGGNPVACAAGLAVLATIRDEGLLANAEARGAELRAGLRAIAAEDDRIGDIRGPGLMVGVEFVRDHASREPDGALPDQLMAACADAGLLVLTCGRQHEVVRWIPPLDVSAAEIAEAVEIFGETLGSIPRA
jgi:4-aminobutyrate aminotransferase